MALANEILSSLKVWCDQGKLKHATLSAAGLTLDQTQLENELLTIEIGDGKVYNYSLASIFLQILDPNQGLLAYRNACKQHNVDDPVKAIDKPAVVGFFFGTKDSTAQTEAPSKPEGTATTETVTAETATASTAQSKPVPTAVEPPSRDKVATVSSKSDRHRSDRHHKHKSSRSHHKDGRKRERTESHKQRESKSPKKKPKEVTNEELFSNLSVVVEKRTTDLDATRIEITRALSADGFEVTAEVLEQHREAAQQIFKNEIPVGNSASILRASNPRKDLSRVLQIFNETINPPKPPSRSKSARGPPSNAKPTNQRPHLVGKKPVIVVPKGMTAPITLTNAYEFFSNGRFLPRDVAIKQGNASARSARVTFTRQVRAATCSGPVEFEIIDNPKKLGGDLAEWDRIVAVVVLGQAWQFKDWIGPYSNPVQLFARTFGFYISMEGDRTPKDVATWSVKQAKLHRDKRGLDSVTSASFWNGVETWMTVNRRELLPQTHDG